MSNLNTTVITKKIEESEKVDWSKFPRELVQSTKLQQCDIYPKEDLVGEELKCSFTFTINCYSLFNKKVNECIRTPIFSMENNQDVKWQINIYPEGHNNNSEGFISLFLEQCFEKSLKVKVNYSISILDKNFQKFREKKVSDKIFDEQSSNWGFPKFSKKNIIFNVKNNLLNDDCLTVFFTMSGHILTNYCIKEINSVNLLEISTSTPAEKKLKLNDDDKFAVKQENQKFVNKSHEKLWIKLLNDNKYFDVNIIVGDKKITAHKCILSISSKKFAEELCKTENNKKIILIQDFSFDVIMEMLRFIYTGTLENLDAIADKLLVAAHEYVVEDLINICEEYLCTTITKDNFVKLFIIADTVGAEKLKKSTVDFFKIHKTEFKDDEMMLKQVMGCQNLVECLLKSF